MKCGLFIVFSTLLALGCAQYLVLVGGDLRDDNARIWNRIVDLGGGDGVAKFGVISASVTTTTESAKVVQNLLTYGALSAEAIPVPKVKADNQRLADRIKALTGIYIVEDTDIVTPLGLFSNIANPFVRGYSPPSGVVSYEGPYYRRQNLINTLRPLGIDSLVLSAIKTVISNGGVVAGNAGIMGKRALILEGSPISALVRGTRFLALPRTPLIINRLGGLALLNADYAIDSLVSEKGREVRVIRTLLQTGVSRGIGVDANTAMVVTDPLNSPNGFVVADIGSVSGVFYSDVSSISSLSIPRGNYQKVPVSFFTLNDTFDFNSGVATFASWKLALAGLEYFTTITPSYDILSRTTANQWRTTTRDLIDSTITTVTCYSNSSLFPLLPRVSVFFDRTQAYGAGLDLPDDPKKTYVASFTNILATIRVLGLTSN